LVENLNAFDMKPRWVKVDGIQGAPNLPLRVKIRESMELRDHPIFFTGLEAGGRPYGSARDKA
jgi:hypothetical protein